MTFAKSVDKQVSSDPARIGYDSWLRFPDEVRVERSLMTDWRDMTAIVTHETPHVARHSTGTDLWIALALDPISIERRIGNVVLPGPPRPNTVIITPPGLDVEDTVLSGGRGLHVIVPEKTIIGVSEEVCGKHIGLDYDSPIGAADMGLVHLMHAARQMMLDDDLKTWRTEYLATAIASHVLDKYARPQSKPFLVTQGPMLSQRQLRLIDEFLRSHLTGEFQFADLAELVGLSRTGFFDRFSRTLGQTPHQYLQAARIAKAKGLLSEGRLSLADIAAASGFCDQTHMARYFKRYTGITPGKYKQEIA